MSLPEKDETNLRTFHILRTVHRNLPAASLCKIGSIILFGEQYWLSNQRRMASNRGSQLTINAQEGQEGKDSCSLRSIFLSGESCWMLVWQNVVFLLKQESSLCNLCQCAEGRTRWLCQETFRSLLEQGEEKREANTVTHEMENHCFKPGLKKLS